MPVKFAEDEAIAFPGSFSAYDMEAIHPALAKSKKSDVYLEVGVLHGRSMNFVRKYFKGDIYGIDIHNQLHPISGINFIHAPSNEAVKNWTLPINILFIDGDHSYEGVKDDWDNFSPFVVKGGIVYFHDCDNTSPGVVQLFNEIDKGWKNKTLWTEKLYGYKTSMASVVKA